MILTKETNFWTNTQQLHSQDRNSVLLLGEGMVMLECGTTLVSEAEKQRVCG